MNDEQRVREIMGCKDGLFGENCGDMGEPCTCFAIVQAFSAPRELRGALQGLVDRLDEIHADPAYKTVWTIHQIHVGPYRGPTYVEELARARAALKAMGVV